MDFLHENDKEVVRNILEPDLFEPDTFEAVPMGMGVTMIVGQLKDQSLVQLQLNPGRQYVQGVKFEKPTWDIQSALEWLQENMQHFEKKDAETVKTNFAKETHNIDGVEVFSVGKWNNQSFTEADLDKMVDTFEKTSDTVRPFLKLGHDDEQALLKKDGLPAAGWVSKLYRKGGKLLADFTDIPKKIYELIENRAYRKVSIELFKNVEILDDKFDFLISGVALLGAETPGVLNLKDILDRFKIKSYDSNCTFSHECEQLIIDLDNNGGSMDQELIDAKARIKELEKEKAKQETELANFKKQSEDGSKTAKQLEQELKETKEKFAKTAKELKEKEIKAQVSELKAAGTITPAMEKGVFQLLSDDIEKFSITKDEKDVDATKYELVKHLFDLAKAGDVNTDEKTVDGDPVGTDKKDLFTKIDAEIETYAKENKVSYGEAYTVVTEKYQDQLKAAE